VAFFACISIMYIGNIIGSVLMSIVNGIQGKPLVTPVSELIENLDTRVIFLLTVVAAPIFEEILYRKLLIDRVAHYGDKAAVIL
ncbi:MAG: CPBP family intramembrane metalloprotease, partial [Clostridiaceae bacterium]|nr:CPBP family intramembrane metalloprotease [Clostridiaceae bacterium]